MDTTIGYASRRTMTIAELVSENPTLANALRKMGYRKKNVVMMHDRAGQRQGLRSYWDEGSRTSYVLVDASGDVHPVPGVSGAPGFTPDPKPFTVTPGQALVELGTFSGKPATAYITMFV